MPATSPTQPGCTVPLYLPKSTPISREELACMRHQRQSSNRISHENLPPHWRRTLMSAVDDKLAVVRAPPGVHQLRLAAGHQHHGPALLQRAQKRAPRHLQRHADAYSGCSMCVMLLQHLGTAEYHAKSAPAVTRPQAPAPPNPRSSRKTCASRRPHRTSMVSWIVPAPLAWIQCGVCKGMLAP